LKVYDIVEKSYDPQAEIKGLNKDIYKNFPVLRDIAIVCSLNNKAGLVYEDGKFNKQGEPTEAALKVFGEKLGQYDYTFTRDADATKNPEAYAKFLDKKYPYLATLDFTSERKTMSTVVRGLQAGNSNSLLLKGAPERVIEKSSFYKKADGSDAQFTQDEKKRLVDQIQNFAKMGLRVLGLAINYNAGKLADLNNNNIEAKLTDLTKYNEYEYGCTFLGFVCIKDPPREEVKGAIADCKTAGIRVIMITGDSKETAVSIAKELQIIENDGPNISFTGTEFEAFSPEKKKQALSGSGGKVFSRVEPRHKRELVKILIDMD